MPKPGDKTPQASVDELTRDLPPGILSVISELRSIIRLSIPNATEKVNMGWRSLNYSHPQVGYFCGLFPFADGVEVAFEFGVLLPDPDGFFDRRGGQVCFARIRSLKELRGTSFKRMLLAAVSLPSDRSSRLALVRSGAIMEALAPEREPKRLKRSP
jgi:hypothetical protein